MVVAFFLFFLRFLTIAGIQNKIDYIESLNVESIILSSVYQSTGNDDIGYDITDHMTIHPMFGTEEQFDQFLAEAHKRGKL